MTKLGRKLIKSAGQALAYASGEPVPGTVVHEPTPAIDVRAVRHKTGLTQAEFAAKFGFSRGAVRNWEQGLRTPQGTTRLLLLIIDREPEVVLRALEQAA